MREPAKVGETGLAGVTRDRGKNGRGPAGDGGPPSPSMRLAVWAWLIGWPCAAVIIWILK